MGIFVLFAYREGEPCMTAPSEAGNGLPATTRSRAVPAALFLATSLLALTADLPHDPPPNSSPAVHAAKEQRDMRSAWASWLGVGVLVNIIWFGTWMGNGPAPYYWPIWVMGPWGAGMLIWTLSSRAGRSEDG